MKTAQRPLIYDPAEDLRSEEAVAVFMAEAEETHDAAYIAHALGVAARATGRNSHNSSSTNSDPPTVNFNQT